MASKITVFAKQDTVKLTFDEDGYSEITFSKDNLQLIFTAITGLYSVGWMDGQNCKLVELEYTMKQITDRIESYKNKQDREVKHSDVIDGQYL